MLVDPFFGAVKHHQDKVGRPRDGNNLRRSFTEGTAEAGRRQRVGAAVGHTPRPQAKPRNRGGVPQKRGG